MEIAFLIAVSDFVKKGHKWSQSSVKFSFDNLKFSIHSSSITRLSKKLYHHLPVHLLTWMTFNNKIRVPDNNSDEMQGESVQQTVQYPLREVRETPTAKPMHQLKDKRKCKNRRGTMLEQNNKKIDDNKSCLPPLRKKHKLKNDSNGENKETRVAPPSLLHNALFANNHSNISAIRQRLCIKLRLTARKKEYPLKSTELEELRKIMLKIDVLMFDPLIIGIDASQQPLLHAVVQQYLASVVTRGDNNCPFYCI